MYPRHRLNGAESNHLKYSQKRNGADLLLISDAVKNVFVLQLCCIANVTNVVIFYHIGNITLLTSSRIFYVMLCYWCHSYVCRQWFIYPEKSFRCRFLWLYFVWSLVAYPPHIAWIHYHLVIATAYIQNYWMKIMFVEFDTHITYYMVYTREHWCLLNKRAQHTLAYIWRNIHHATFEDVSMMSFHLTTGLMCHLWTRSRCMLCDIVFYYHLHIPTSLSISV